MGYTVSGIFQARKLDWVIFPFSRGSSQARGSNPGLPHCKRILYQLSHKGSPRILEWVGYPFSSGYSWSRNRTRVPCIAGRFFTNWAIREALQSLSHVQLFATPWMAAQQASLSFTISLSLLKLMPIESVMPSKHFILCHPLLTLSIFPNIRVFSNESVLHIRWPNEASASASVTPLNIQGWFSLGLTGLISL